MTRARDLAAFVSNADGDIKFDTDTLFIDSSANRVGIGETAPATDLHISSTANPAISIEDTDNGFAASTIQVENGGRDLDITVPQDIIFTNGSDESMRITSAENVSIGTSSAVLTSGNRGNLTISGTSGSILNLADSGNQGAYLFHHSDLHLDVYNTKNGYIRFATNNVERVRIDNSGRVIMNQQPVGNASSNTGETATGKIQLTSNQVSRGGLSIDATNDRMTVPVAGAYLIGYHHLGENASSQVEIRVNGSAQAGSRAQSPNSTAGSNLSISSAIIRELSANDYIEWWCVAGKTHGNTNYNSMYVAFLG